MREKWLTPKNIVKELDKYIIGQKEAKRAAESTEEVNKPLEAPTTAEVLVEAEKLNGFVSQSIEK